MKKIVIAAVIGLAIASCNNSATDGNASTDTSVAPVDHTSTGGVRDTTMSPQDTVTRDSVTRH